MFWGDRDSMGPATVTGDQKVSGSEGTNRGNGPAAKRGHDRWSSLFTSLTKITELKRRVYMVSQKERCANL